jgi:hypothetical protein
LMKAQRKKYTKNGNLHSKNLDIQNRHVLSRYSSFYRSRGEKMRGVIVDRKKHTN